MASGETRGVVLHQLSKKKTQRLPFKIRGLPVCTLFHPSLSYIFVATRKDVRVYNLLKPGEATKKLETGLKEISSMAIHPGGDNLIVGSKEGKMCWFDMDLSSKPYKTLKNHPKDITNVAVHRSYPLFASCSEDSTAYVFHGMVYNDLNQNPLIVPLEILRGHSSKGGQFLWRFWLYLEYIIVYGFWLFLFDSRNLGLQVSPETTMAIHCRRWLNYQTLLPLNWSQTPVLTIFISCCIHLSHCLKLYSDRLCSSNYKGTSFVMMDLSYTIEISNLLHFQKLSPISNRINLYCSITTCLHFTYNEGWTLDPRVDKEKIDCK